MRVVQCSSMSAEEIVLVPAVIAGIAALIKACSPLLPKIQDALRNESDDDQVQ